MPVSNSSKSSFLRELRDGVSTKFRLPADVADEMKGTVLTVKKWEPSWADPRSPFPGRESTYDPLGGLARFRLSERHCDKQCSIHADKSGTQTLVPHQTTSSHLLLRNKVIWFVGQRVESRLRNGPAWFSATVRCVERPRMANVKKTHHKNDFPEQYYDAIFLDLIYDIGDVEIGIRAVRERVRPFSGSAVTWDLQSESLPKIRNSIKQLEKYGYGGNPIKKSDTMRICQRKGYEDVKACVVVNHFFAKYGFGRKFRAQIQYKNASRRESIGKSEQQRIIISHRKLIIAAIGDTMSKQSVSGDDLMRLKLILENLYSKSRTWLKGHDTNSTRPGIVHTPLDEIRRLIVRAFRLQRDIDYVHTLSVSRVKNSVSSTATHEGVKEFTGLHRSNTGMCSYFASSDAPFMAPLRQIPKDLVVRASLRSEGHKSLTPVSGTAAFKSKVSRIESFAKVAVYTDLESRINLDVLSTRVNTTMAPSIKMRRTMARKRRNSHSRTDEITDEASQLIYTSRGNEKKIIPQKKYSKREIVKQYSRPRIILARKLITKNKYPGPGDYDIYKAYQHTKKRSTFTAIFPRVKTKKPVNFSIIADKTYDNENESVVESCIFDNVRAGRDTKDNSSSSINRHEHSETSQTETLKCLSILNKKSTTTDLIDTCQRHLRDTDKPSNSNKQWLLRLWERDWDLHSHSQHRRFEAPASVRQEKIREKEKSKDSRVRGKTVAPIQRGKEIGVYAFALSSQLARKRSKVTIFKSCNRSGVTWKNYNAFSKMLAARACQTKMLGPGYYDVTNAVRIAHGPSKLYKTLATFGRSLEARRHTDRLRQKILKRTKRDFNTGSSDYFCGPQLHHAWAVPSEDVVIKVQEKNPSFAAIDKQNLSRALFKGYTLTKEKRIDGLRASSRAAFMKRQTKDSAKGILSWRQHDSRNKSSHKKTAILQQSNTNAMIMPSDCKDLYTEQFSKTKHQNSTIDMSRTTGRDSIRIYRKNQKTNSLFSKPQHRAGSTIEHQNEGSNRGPGYRYDGLQRAEEYLATEKGGFGRVGEPSGAYVGKRMTREDAVKCFAQSFDQTSLKSVLETNPGDEQNVNFGDIADTRPGRRVRPQFTFGKAERGLLSITSSRIKAQGDVLSSSPYQFQGVGNRVAPGHRYTSFDTQRGRAVIDGFQGCEDGKEVYRENAIQQQILHLMLDSDNEISLPDVDRNLSMGENSVIKFGNAFLIKENEVQVEGSTLLLEPRLSPLERRAKITSFNYGKERFNGSNTQNIRKKKNVFPMSKVKKQRYWQTEDDVNTTEEGDAIVYADGNVLVLSPNRADALVMPRATRDKTMVKYEQSFSSKDYDIDNLQLDKFQSNVNLASDDSLDSGCGYKWAVNSVRWHGLGGLAFKEAVQDSFRCVKSRDIDEKDMIIAAVTYARDAEISIETARRKLLSTTVTSNSFVVNMDHSTNDINDKQNRYDFDLSPHRADNLVKSRASRDKTMVQYKKSRGRWDSEDDQSFVDKMNLKTELLSDDSSCSNESAWALKFVSQHGLHDSADVKTIPPDNMNANVRVNVRRTTTNCRPEKRSVLSQNVHSRPFKQNVYYRSHSLKSPKEVSYRYSDQNDNIKRARNNKVVPSDFINASIREKGLDQGHEKQKLLPEVSVGIGVSRVGRSLVDYSRQHGRLELEQFQIERAKRNTGHIPNDTIVESQRQNNRVELDLIIGDEMKENTMILSSIDKVRHVSHKVIVQNNKFAPRIKDNNRGPNDKARRAKLRTLRLKDHDSNMILAQSSNDQDCIPFLRSARGKVAVHYVDEMLSLREERLPQEEFHWFERYLEKI